MTLQPHTPQEHDGASLATLDPMARLAAAVVTHALDDLKGSDSIMALDAFLWLLESGPLWLEALGIDATDLDCLSAAGGLRHDKKTKPTRDFAQGCEFNGQEAISPIQGRT